MCTVQAPHWPTPQPNLRAGQLEVFAQDPQEGRVGQRSDGDDASPFTVSVVVIFCDMGPPPGIVRRFSRRRPGGDLLRDRLRLRRNEPLRRPSGRQRNRRLKPPRSSTAGAPASSATPPATHRSSSAGAGLAVAIRWAFTCGVQPWMDASYGPVLQGPRRKPSPPRFRQNSDIQPGHRQHRRGRSPRIWDGAQTLVPRIGTGSRYMDGGLP